MDIIKQWLKIVDSFFNSEEAKQKPEEERRIGVHCVAGLGRAPFLVAISLINAGCTPVNAISLI